MTPRTKRKQAINLSLRPELVERARALGLNLSQVVDAALERALREHERAAWLAENKEAIEAYNEHVAKHGLFSDRWRRF
ncbi:MAG TPA: type II toxin-antitoxin system CcdA family antitoxin [Kofleriaceae bacterium]|nr:type II toxin-antitoxin system CcdA family antitoxin [Kofleriaceae bacterium]